MKKLIAMLMMVAGVASAELTVEAELDRRSMSTDDRAVLTVTVKGGQQVDIELPNIEGVSYREMGRSQNMQIINGTVSVSLTQQILVTVAEAGSYQIPAVRVAGGGEEAFSQGAMRLEVVKGAGRPRGRSGASPAPNMGTKQGGGGGAVSADDAGELAFLTVNPSRTELVVGELVPVEVKAYFRSGERVSLRSLPSVGGGAFTMKNQEGQPRQEQVTVDGVAYTALTFYAGMAAVKPGEFPVEVSLDATVVVREKGSGRGRMQGMRQRMQSLLNDPFFGDPFGDDFFGRLVEKEVSLKADPVTLTVGEVPLDGRPEGYAGAVGKFSVTASAAVDEVAVGEPVTVKLTVTGEGNFDRVGVPQLAAAAGWKTYPATSESVAGDAIGYSGTKVFEQVIIPERGGSEGVEFELPYYNAEEKRFEVARSGVLPLVVSGEAVPVSEVVAVGEAGAEVLVPAVVEAAEAEEAAEAARPLYGRWWFVGVCGISVVVLGFCGVRGLVGRRKVDPSLEVKRAMEREIEVAVAGMERAMAETNAVAFFESMRRGVQVYAARLLGVVPEAVTAADVGDAELKEMLVAADAVVFSGMPVDAGEMARWLGKAEKLKS